MWPYMRIEAGAMSKCQNPAVLSWTESPRLYGCTSQRRFRGKRYIQRYTMEVRKTIAVSCDVVTDGGGWTVFQRRFTGALSFTRTFADYESGFGDLGGEFWLGLKYVQEMAAIGESELRLDAKALDGTDLYEVFSNFSLTQSPDYRLFIQPGHGSIGDDDPKHGLSYVYGQPFSTNDHDVSPGHCPHYQKSGWWYKSCGYINLNAHHDMKMFYTTSHGYESLKETQMMLRRNNV